MDASAPRIAALGTAGFAAAVLTGVAGGRAYTGTSTPPTRWFGLIPESGFVPGDSPVWGVLLWTGITALSLCWLGVVWLRREVGIRGAWALAGAWALPLVVGPPVVSKDVWAYAAQSVLLHRGLDVYRVGPLALGPRDSAALAAVDPRWQDSPSPYGPVSTLLLRGVGAASGGDPTIAAVLVRIVAVLAVGALVWLCTLLSGAVRVDAVLLIGLNPLVLVHALSAAHVEALMCALLVAALVLAQRGWFEAAVLVASLAGAVKAPAYLAVPVVMLWHVLAPALPARERLLRLGRDVVMVAGSTALVSALAPDGWGWLRNLRTPTKGDPTSSITGHLASLTGSADVVRVIGATVAVAIVAWLLVTFRRRPMTATVGLGLLAVAFLAPVTYPWYVLWGVVCLLPSATGRARVALIALCVAEAGLSIPGAPGSITGPLVLAVVLAALVSVGYLNRPHRTVPAT